MISCSPSRLGKIILVIFCISLLSGLLPVVDTDSDGVRESFLAELDMALPILGVIAFLVILFSLPHPLIPISRPSFSNLLLPPPII
jgi:hypothetical protein